jgi:hypothetical protein
MKILKQFPTSQIRASSLSLCVAFSVVIAANVSAQANVEQSKSDQNPINTKTEMSSPLTSDSHLTVSIRTLMGRETIDDTSSKHAWTENFQFNFTSGYTSGLVGLGLDVSPFVMLKVMASDNAGNMAHVNPDGSPGDDRMWAYFGKYLLKMKAGDSVLKYGLQQVANPFLESNDLRGLPPSFRGTSLQSNVASNFNVDLGSFDAYKGRGHTELGKLTTAYGNVRFKRLDYIGGNWAYAKDAKFIAYVSQAQDVWNQSFVSMNGSWGNINSVEWTTAANLYSTNSQGRQLEGEIHNRAMSVAFAGKQGNVELKLAYQKIQSEQFFDFVKDTWGMWLANVFAVDFNAPHEQSLKLTTSIDGNAFGMQGLKLNLWSSFGWGADASVMARKHQRINDPLHSLYWKNGQPIQGKHHDIGSSLNYTVPSGEFKGGVLGLILVRHRSTHFYADNSFGGFRLNFDMPINVF